MAKLTDESPMPFGVHKDKSMEDVPASYLRWLYDTGKVTDDVKEYIEENLDVIDLEIKRNNRNPTNKNKI